MEASTPKTSPCQDGHKPYVSNLIGVDRVEQGPLRHGSRTAQLELESRGKTLSSRNVWRLLCLPLKNTTFQLFGGNMGYMSVKD